MTSFRLEVQGDLACFTRPEMKAERVSYEVITPSAARAIFESILWKPAIRWEVDRIEVLRPIRWITIRRNEVGHKASTPAVIAAMRGGGGSLALFVDDAKERQQRASLLLRDVAYRLSARMVVTPAMGVEPLIKFEEMFRRRATNGQCVNQPYLGCREFACRVHLVGGAEPSPPPLDETRDLGIMLYDLDYTSSSQPTPIWFQARLVRGVLEVPAWSSTELQR